MTVKRRLLALFLVALTLAITAGVSVYALQPPVNNIVTQSAGFWQNQAQDGNRTYSYQSLTCPCGATLYSLGVFHSVTAGDIVNIAPTAGTGQVTYADCGIVTALITDTHNLDDHRNGVYFYDQDGTTIYTSLTKTINTPMSLVILIEDNSANTYSDDLSFFVSNIVGSATNTIRTYALVNCLSSIYDDNIRDIGYQHGYEDGLYVSQDSAYRDGYADGQINAQANIGAIDLIAEVIDGVSLPIIDALNDISFFGLSLMSLAGMVITVMLIMLIVKIVRG